MDSSQLLRQIMQSKNRRGSFPIGDFFLEHAVEMPVRRARECGIAQMTAKQCFDNALAMTIHHPQFGRYVYCEGYWLHHSNMWAPIDHAWVYDTYENRYIDPTIPHDERGTYIGIKIPLTVLLQCHAGSRWKGNVIDTLWRGYPMPREEITRTRSLLEEIN